MPVFGIDIDLGPRNALVRVGRVMDRRPRPRYLPALCGGVYEPTVPIVPSAAFSRLHRFGERHSLLPVLAVEQRGRPRT